MARRDRGTLEASVLAVLSASPTPMASRDVLAELDAQGMSLALTTVITALQRLTQKGVVIRLPGPTSRLWVFEAAQTPSERAVTSMTSALADAPDREAVLMQFTGSLSDDDLSVLRKALGK